MLTSTTSILFHLAIVTLFLVAVFGQQTQFMQFYTASNCSGTPFLTTGGSGNHTVTRTNSSFYTKHSGLWAIEICQNNIVIPCNTVRVIRAGDNQTCTALPAVANTTQLHITRFGDPWQVERTITYFQYARFTGESITVTAAGANFSSRTAQSYFFAGLNSWEHRLYMDHFVSTCRNYSSEVGSKGYGFTFAESTSFGIGYARYGCGVTQGTTTRRPNSGNKMGFNSISLIFVILATVGIPQY